MKALCFSLLVLMTFRVPLECRRYKEENQQSVSEEAWTKFKEFLNGVGFSTFAKSDEELKQEVPFWIAKVENQDRFLAKLTDQIKEEKNDVSNEMIEVLGSIKNAMRLWTETFNTEKNAPKEKRPFYSGVKQITLFCSRKGCHCCRECNSVEEKIEAMRDEVADLKSEALETLLKAGWEAAGTGVTIAAGQPELALVPGIYATRDFVSACEIYNEAKELERQADDLEKFNQEERGIKEDTSDKHWWQLWK